MAWTADGKWTPEDDSVSTKLNGLLASDSKYITQARTAGQRAAGKRGLLNSSIAAGAGESAAIAAALPIASQDASTLAQKNQSTLEGRINLDNSTTLQGQQDKSAMERLQADAAAQAERQKEAIGGQLTLQERSDAAAAARQSDQLSTQEKLGLLSSQTSLAQSKLDAQSNMTSAYLSFMGSLGTNSKLKSGDRNAYIAEAQRVTNMSSLVSQDLSGVQLGW